MEDHDFGKPKVSWKSKDFDSFHSDYLQGKDNDMS